MFLQSTKKYGSFEPSHKFFGTYCLICGQQRPRQACTNMQSLRAFTACTHKVETDFNEGQGQSLFL